MADQTVLDRDGIEVRVRVRQVIVGDKVKVVLPFSEVCMYMRVAGLRAEVVVLPRMAQIWLDGREFSAPVTHGEAGVYGTGSGLYVMEVVE